MKKKVNLKLAKALHDRREEKELTLVQLSKLSGVSTSYVARVERGERFPSGLILRKLAKPLGFSEIELLKLAGFMARDDSDVRIERLKEEMKSVVTQALAKILERIDSL